MEKNGAAGIADGEEGMKRTKANRKRRIMTQRITHTWVRILVKMAPVEEKRNYH